MLNFTVCFFSSPEMFDLDIKVYQLYKMSWNAFSLSIVSERMSMTLDSPVF